MRGIGIRRGFSRPGGKAPAFAPALLGASLIAWWSADRSDLITTSGGSVSSWRDSVAGYDAVQGTAGARPAHSLTSFNGAPGVTFDGTDDELTCTTAGLLAALPAAAVACELWAVIQQDALVGDATSRYCGGYGDTLNTSRVIGRRLVTVSRGNLLVGTGGNAAQAQDLTVETSGRHALRGQFADQANSVSVDGGTPAATTAPQTPATTATRLRLGAGAAAAAANFWNGKIRHFMVTGPLAPLQAQQLTTWCLGQRML